HSNGFTCTASTCSGLAGGAGDGQFKNPAQVVADSSGNIYVADDLNFRVDKFSGGVFSGWAGLCTGGTNCVTSGGADHSNGFTCTASTCTGLGQGSGDGQFDTVNWVGVDHSGNVYVSDYQNARVDEFSGGVFVGWAGGCTGGVNCVSSSHSNGFTCTAATCTGAGTTGSGDGQFNGPQGVGVDSLGDIYIVD